MITTGAGPLTSQSHASSVIPSIVLHLTVLRDIVQDPAVADGQTLLVILSIRTFNDEINSKCLVSFILQIDIEVECAAVCYGKNLYRVMIIHISG